MCSSQIHKTCVVLLFSCIAEFNRKCLLSWMVVIHISLILFLSQVEYINIGASNNNVCVCVCVCLHMRADTHAWLCFVWKYSIPTVYTVLYIYYDDNVMFCYLMQDATSTTNPEQLLIGAWAAPMSNLFVLIYYILHFNFKNGYMHTTVFHFTRAPWLFIL
jgi:hypothetical protein